MIEHQSVISFRNDVIYRYLDSSFDHSILFFSNYVFDVSVEQVVLSILNSQTLIIPDKLLVFDDNFYVYLNQYNLTYLSGTPSKIQQIGLHKLHHLKTIILAGEELKENAYNQIRIQFNGIIRNALGPTEASIYNTDFAFLKENDKFKNSVGKPLTNTKAFVLNNQQLLLPINAIGELYLSGDCLSRGYLNRPDLTADRFLPNPFQTEEEKRLGKNSRIYKTGDLVRMLSNGELEYLGRNDFQVKIRGLRIELGEIENAISSFEGIKQAVVLAKDKSYEKKQKYLIGYYVSENILDESDIKEYIQTKIPEYMVPNRLVRIEKVPVTINGKLDKKALPEIEFTAQKDNYEAPRNEIESKLCQIWSEVLGLENVGINDDFFKLGGDSIQSIQIVGRINQDLRIHVSIKDIFSFKTIKNISDHGINLQFDSNQFNADLLRSIQIHDQFKSKYLERLKYQENISDFFLANALQQGLLYHSLKQGDEDDAYIVQLMIEYKSVINEKLMKQSWKCAQQRFPALRLRFDWQEEIIQIIDKDQELDWRSIDLTQIDDIESKIKDIEDNDRKERFNLDIGNLNRIQFIKLKEDYFELIITSHHIILDGWSGPIILDYVHRVYSMLLEGREVDTKSDQSYENTQLHLQAHIGDHVDYWTKEIESVEERPDLNGLLKPEFKNRIILSEYDHVKNPSKKELVIDKDNYYQLKSVCKENGITLNSVLQFVWHKVLSIYGNSKQNCCWNNYFREKSSN